MHLSSATPEERASLVDAPARWEAPPLTVSIAHHGDTIRVGFAGEVDASLEDQFCDAVTAAMAASAATDVVVDLSAVTFIDSCGLRGLLRCSTLCEERGATLRFAVGVASPVRRLFEVTGLSDWFAQHSTD